MAPQRFVLVPDSFKGTMSSLEICQVLREKILQHQPSASVRALPVADGGEGSVDAFLSAMGGQKVFVRVQNPFGEEMEAFYGLVDEGRTAIIEMAACAGLPLAEGRLNPEITTTYGVGQLMLDALQRGVRKCILALGGSATNDMAFGLCAALGVRFYNEAGAAFVPTGGTLGKAVRIDLSGLTPLLQGVELVAMCDIDNPLYGPTGAAHVFAPQKGADAEMVARLDEQLHLAAETLKNTLSQDVAQLPGAGAAGGMGAGLVALLGARLQMGIDTLLDTVGFDDILSQADIVLTGEGRIDSQSLRGKVVIGVARRAKRRGVPVVALVGDIEDPIDAAYDEGVTAVLSINRKAIPFSEARHRSRDDLARTCDTLMRLLQL